jgi:hypothetical protein
MQSMITLIRHTYGGLILEIPTVCVNLSTCARTCAARTENAGTGVEANTGAGI